MDRKTLKEFTHKAAKFLEIKDRNYKQWVFRYTFLELEKDLGEFGDITTQFVLEENKLVTGVITTKEDGVLAGIDEIKYFLVDADPNFRQKVKGEFKIDFKYKDGQKVKVGDVVMEISANSHDLLATERVVLNLLMRMSGVATFTRRIVDLVADTGILITPTRKTLWGLVDKKAVVVGGGGTHRLNLSDAILVKDNHLKLLNGNFEELFKKLTSLAVSTRFCEVEVESLEDAVKCAEMSAKYPVKSVFAIMLDNMSAEDVKKTVDTIKDKGFYDNILLEASGGITEKNVLQYAKTGVDIISMGCLTSGARSLDLGMEIK